MSKFHVTNFGCRASQADGAAIESLLSKHGLEPAADHRSAEVVILNTCTVTAAADDELRQIVRRVNRANPDAKIVVTGCYAQRAPEDIIRLPGVSMVVGNSHKARIAELLMAPYHGEVYVGDIFASREFTATPVEDASGDRSRPNLKIQDGCSNRCSFCIIPFVRGHSRSAPLRQIIEQVYSLSLKYPEVVLTGINLGRWGREAGMKMRLADLLRILLAETGVQRLRLSSVEPMDWSDDLLHLMASSPRIARHMHAPLQSGSDAVLRRMRRKYRPHHYESRVRLARELMPEAAIGADVMVGFPGETQAEFDETRRFIDRLPFTYLHIFPYSERPGTPAAAAADQVPVAVRRERGRILKALAEQKNLAFRRRMLGRTLSVVVQGNGSEGMASNYVPVEFVHSRRPLQIVEVAAGQLTKNGIREYTPLPILC